MSTSSKYRYENLRLGHLPKHWSTDDQQVYMWQPFLTTPYPLENLLGTYRVVSMRNEDEPQWRLGEENPGFIKLGLRSGQAATWENVYGVFQVLNDFKRGAFNGLMPHEQVVAWTLETKSPPRPTLRRFDLITSYERRIPLKGHALEVLDAVDGNGNNYIAIMFEYCVERSNCISFMGKKQSGDEANVGFTDEERRKLGISLSFDEVEALGKSSENL
ncbi:hypothetical protein DFH06DRAFT_1190906 [Mycena polygramma]|nr:hypothetical protein DFH06DRAFT_1190906 [Mycena polygramma]